MWQAFSFVESYLQGMINLLQDHYKRVNIFKGFQVLWDSISPTVEAMLQLQGRTSEASERGITTRLLVPSSKVGCLLGQGGQIISEMRRRTRADIRVYSKDDKPQYASANEELVQVLHQHHIAVFLLSATKYSIIASELPLC